MTDRHDARSWETFLPPTYKWLESLDVSVTTDLPSQSCLIIPVKYDDGIDLAGTKLAADKRKLIEVQAKSAGWRGKGSEFLCVGDQTVLLVPVAKLDVGAVRLSREAGFSAAKATGSREFETVVFVDNGDYSALSAFEGYCQGAYSQGLFKGEAEKKSLPKKITLLEPGVKAAAVAEVKSLSRALLFTRMLQDAPANWLTPERWGKIAMDYFRTKSVEVSVLGRSELLALNMGSFLSVASGSPLDPKLISIKINGKKPGKRVALVGKGLTFDAGGISIKPSLGMGEMKYDMSGGAAVMGAAHFLCDHQPEVDVHCIIGAVENMPSGTATRPGDIVQARNGKTIEVLNTDAEGRLVLADLLCYAAEAKPNLIIDLATLTGAVLQGLGSAGAGLMANKDEVAAYIMNVGRKMGEPFWQLPLWPELAAEVKSDCADLKNIAKPNVMAGTIIGGIFLKEFVPDSIPWAHMDIAGTGWNCAATGYPKSGGSGFAVRTIAEICRHFEL